MTAFAQFPTTFTNKRRELVHFTKTSGGIALEKKVNDAFVVCRDVIAPLGELKREVQLVLDRVPVGLEHRTTRYEYEAPCKAVAFIIVSNEVRAGRFNSRAPGTPPKNVEVKFTGDLNDDGTADFLVVDKGQMQLLLSTGEGLSSFASE